MTLRLPNLKVLTLHDCPSISAAGVLPVLRSSTRLESLYLGAASVVSTPLLGAKEALIHLHDLSIESRRARTT